MKVPQAAVLEEVSSSAATPCRRFTQGMGSPARSMPAVSAASAPTSSPGQLHQERFVHLR